MGVGDRQAARIRHSVTSAWSAFLDEVVQRSIDNTFRRMRDHSATRGPHTHAEVMASTRGEFGASISAFVPLKNASSYGATAGARIRVARLCGVGLLTSRLTAASLGLSEARRHVQDAHDSPACRAG